MPEITLQALSGSGVASSPSGIKSFFSNLAGNVAAQGASIGLSVLSRYAGVKSVAPSAYDLVQTTDRFKAPIPSPKPTQNAFALSTGVLVIGSLLTVGTVALIVWGLRK